MIDLTAKLQQETSQSITASVMTRLQQNGFPMDPGVDARFQAYLNQAIEQRIRVRLLWFVTSYPGGRYAFENDPFFTKCRQVVHDHERDGSKFISGVAGFIVLENFADTSINNNSAMNAALGMTFGPAATHIIDSKLETSWMRAVKRVVRVEAHTQAMTQTVYPLWIQFE